LKAIILKYTLAYRDLWGLVWIFQDGHLRTFLVSIRRQYRRYATSAIFCDAFGLSMDYEVFLLSRIKECYDATHDNHAASFGGFATTGW